MTLAAVACGLAVCAVPAAQSRVIHVPLEYRAPGDGPKPNFSPIGTKVTLTPVDGKDTLPPGASRPAGTGTIQIGPDAQSWIHLLVTADPAHPKDLCRLYIDRNGNGNRDDGPPVTRCRHRTPRPKPGGARSTRWSWRSATARRGTPSPTWSTSGGARAATRRPSDPLLGGLVALRHGHRRRHTRAGRGDGREQRRGVQPSDNWSVVELRRPTPKSCCRIPRRATPAG